MVEQVFASHFSLQQHCDTSCVLNVTSARRERSSSIHHPQTFTHRRHIHPYTEKEEEWGNVCTALRAYGQSVWGCGVKTSGEPSWLVISAQRPASKSPHILEFYKKASSYSKVGLLWGHFSSIRAQNGCPWEIFCKRIIEEGTTESRMMKPGGIIRIQEVNYSMLLQSLSK